MRKKLLTSILVLSMVCSVISEHTAFAASVATQPAISTDSTETTDTIKDTDTTKNTNTQKSYSFKKNTFSYKSSSQSVSPLTNSTYTHADAFDGMYIFNGIDVSYHNGTIDWNAVAATGIDYAILRVGYRGYGSTGNLCADVKFDEYIQGAIAAGIPVGVYYYTEAISTDEAIAEANYCIEKIKDYNITLPVTIDFEPGTNKGRSYKANLSKTQATNQVKAFCDTIAAAGYTPAIYANKSDLTTRIDGASLGSSYNIWLAQYNSKTTYTGAYQQWQYSSSGTISGISGKVDCNFFYSAADSLTSTAPTGTSIASATISSIPNQTYSGKAISPAVTVRYNGQTLLQGTDYKLTYSNNTAIGKASVTAKGIGAYRGSVTRQYNINPAKISSFKSKSASRQITLKWKKGSNKCGYQIFRKNTYNAKSYKKVKTISANTTTKWINKKLTYNREYYYYIRPYKTVNGANFYGSLTYLTTSTTPRNKKRTIRKKTALYKKPSLKGTKLATIPKKAKITCISRTYVTASKKVYHVTYKKGSKTYTGYIAGKTRLY